MISAMLNTLNKFLKTYKKNIRKIVFETRTTALEIDKNIDKVMFSGHYASFINGEVNYEFGLGTLKDFNIVGNVVTISSYDDNEISMVLYFDDSAVVDEIRETFTY